MQTTPRPACLARIADSRKRSLKLRRCLEIAGIVRSDLFPETNKQRPSPATRKPMTFHDLRATGIT